MDQEIKARWLSKLRSGNYNQTKNKLNDSAGYCCLGVLCEIAVEDGIVIKTNEDGFAVYTAKTNPSDWESSVLPYAVQMWAGVDDTNPSVIVVDSNNVEDDACLAELNDRGMTFDEIADLIEESL